MTFKRYAALMLALIIIFSALSFTGCRSEEPEESPAPTEESGEVSFIPGAEPLTITIPACAVDIIEDNLYNMASGFGITDIRDGSGGTLVCYIGYSTKAEVQMMAKKNLYDTTQYLIGGTDFIEKGDIGKDFDSFVFFCDADAYAEPADVYLLSYYIPALTYHALTTPDSDFLFNKKMSFTFIDKDSFRELGKFEFDGQLENNKPKENN